MIGEKNRRPHDVSGLLRVNGNPGAESNVVISGEFVSKEPELTARIIKALVEHAVRVYYSRVSLPNLLLEEDRVFQIFGSTVREAQGVDGRGLLYELKWVLTRKYLMVSGTVETVEFRDPSEVWIRLRERDEDPSSCVELVMVRFSALCAESTTNE